MISHNHRQPDVQQTRPPQVAVDRVRRRDGRRPGRDDQEIGPTTANIEAYRALAGSNGLHLLSSVDPPEPLVANILERLEELGVE